VRAEVAVWQRHRNNLGTSVNWQFTTPDGRIKLRWLYPSIES